jgi:ornithine cyclodeaminase/alanine dehydrogenase-like protein (mu-crystallin family)
LRAAVSCFERVFTQQARGELVTWPPLHLVGAGANLQLRTGGLPVDGQMGVRVSAGSGQVAYVALHELTSGRMLSLLGYPFSTLRLNACVALAVDRLARPGPARVAVLGTGRRALGLLEAVCAVRAVQHVDVFSPTVEHRTRFAAQAPRVLGVPVNAVDDPATAVAHAEIVVVMTDAERPALAGAWLPPQALVIGAGRRTELDEEVYLRADLIVASSREQEIKGPLATDDWTLANLIRKGALQAQDVVELGEVVAGTVTPGDGITVFREAQGGFTDIALAALAYERAVAAGRGTEWPGP